MASNNFINECKNRANGNRLGKIIVDDVETPITNSNNLKNFCISDGCYVNGNIIGTIYIKKLSGEFISLPNGVELVDKSIDTKIGVKYSNGSTEYIDMGNFKVEHPTNEKTANKCKIIAYDYLINKIDNKYVCGIDYSSPKTLGDLYIDLCRQLELTPVTTTFLNSTIPITSNPFQNGERNRLVLQTILKVACSFATIDNTTNKIDLSWLSNNDEPDYTFELNDYSSLEGGMIQYGPINSVTIKNSQIDDENVTQKDQSSIDEYGEHSLVINENYILYNSTLRTQAMTAIFNRLNGLKYFDSKLTTYYGKPFLKIGDKIRIKTGTNTNDYFDTYVLIHEFNYDGTFESIIESPSLTQEEISNKQDVSLAEVLKNTEIQVKKQQGEIDLLTEKVVDISSTQNGSGSIILQNCSETPLYKLVIKGACQDFPSSSLFPSTTLYPKGRWLRITHQDNTFERYKLPVLSLRTYNSTTDDLTIENGKVKITKRVGINSDSSLYLLENPVVINCDDLVLYLKEGTNVVWLESFPNSSLEATYLLKNDYTDVYAPKLELKSLINLCPEGVKIEGKNVDITGTASFNNNVVITPDGKMKAVDGEFSGNIYFPNSNSKVLGGQGLLTNFVFPCDNLVALGQNQTQLEGATLKKTMLQINSYIPSNFTVTEACLYVFLYKTGNTFVNPEFDGTGDLDISNYGKVSHIKLYKISNSTSYANSSDYGIFEIEGSGYQVENAFGQDGYTADTEEFSSFNSLINLKNELETGINKFYLQTGDALLNGNLESDTILATQQTQIAYAVLNVIGYSNSN